MKIPAPHDFSTAVLEQRNRTNRSSLKSIDMLTNPRVNVVGMRVSIFFF